MHTIYILLHKFIQQNVFTYIRISNFSHIHNCIENSSPTMCTQLHQGSHNYIHNRTKCIQLRKIAQTSIHVQTYIHTREFVANIHRRLNEINIRRAESELEHRSALLRAVPALTIINYNIGKG